MAPWADYILASLVLTSDASKTVAVGLYSWMDSTMINVYFTKFAAGCVVVAIPIVTLYIFCEVFH
jgi:arabinogalactan oligomer/maltooligosaccharide transport system permease protein